MNTLTKCCKACAQLLPLEKFYRRSNAKDGRQSICKQCQSIRYGHKPREKLPSGMRRCSRCKQVMPTSKFYQRSDRTFRSHCKKCVNIDTREYRARYSERLRPLSALRMRYWRHRNRNRYASYRRQRYSKLRDKINISRRNREKTTGISRISCHRRRTQSKALLNKWDSIDWQRCLDYWHHRCAICGRPQGLWHTLAMDHWIPLSSLKCPGTVPTNIIPLCHSVAGGENGCNNTKYNRNPVEWLTERYSARKAKQILKRIETYFEWVKSRE